MKHLLVWLWFGLVFGAPSCCTPSQPCWPSPSELSALSAALDPTIPRNLTWRGAGTPLPCAVPYASPGDQPLYGEGQHLLPLTQSDTNGQLCFNNGFSTPFCRLVVRNNPMFGWSPGLVAWPTSASQVQTLVQFASQHNLCLSVAGTGHDFLHRHSLDGSLFVRTSLMKSVEWTSGGVVVGPGLTFAELHYAASKANRSLASGWATTVGIVGWSLGGGHGPLSPKLGLGSDQILGVQMVGPDGSLYTATETGTRRVGLDGKVEESGATDLLWAVRGGGGSTWGVITSLTLKTHDLPQGGYTSVSASLAGDLCSGEGTLLGLLETYLAWAMTLDENWGGLAWFTPQKSNGTCSVVWSFNLIYLYQGSSSDPTFKATLQDLLNGAPALQPQVTTYPDMWSIVLTKALEPIIPVSYLAPSGTMPGGLPSILISRETVADGSLSQTLKSQIHNCFAQNCYSYQFYQDITGNINSPQDPNVSVNPGMRSAIFHLVVILPTLQDVPTFYKLGEYSYFSESAFSMDSWQNRYWGPNYPRLLQIKQTMDPQNKFWCHHCVGDTSL